FAECTVDYYQRALDYLPANCSVFVFSDDILWAKQNLNLGKTAVFIGDGTPRSGIEDLKLMSLGHHHVIANSTFSWWGAWLAGPNKGLTIAPARWFVDEAIVDSDLFPDDWIRC
ncbi:MAG: alpha-1,2-fucosyltransferase, partial [Pirellula sp.]|nr:alpha-1,2-fucosyltransferase [Pirellula sp.]